MTAFRLLQLVESRALLDPKSVVQLREQLASVQRSVTADELAKLLVKRGRLTEYQANSLLDDLRELARAEQAGVDLAADTESSLELLADSDEELIPLEAVPVAEPVAVEVDEQELESSETSPPIGELGALGDEAEFVGGAASTSGNRFNIKSLFARKQGWQRGGRGPNFLLVGSGALVLLSLLGGLIYFFLTRESGDALFEAAQEAYSAQAYDNAIKNYDSFLRKFSRHPSYSLAKVRRELSLIRKPVETADWDRAIDQFESGLENMKPEPAFREVQPELAGILPTIFDGFATQADAATGADEKEQQLGLAAKVYAQIEDPTTLPGSQRQSIELSLKDTQKLIAKVERDITRERSLDDALVDISKAVGVNNTMKAYAVHKMLIDQYPGLRSNSALVQQMGQIAEAEKNAVVVLDSGLKATASDYPLQIPNRVLVARRRGAEGTGVPGQVFAMAHGALYGLSADSGKTLWRRWLGFESMGSPVTLGVGQSTDVIMFDAARQELLRLDGPTGTLQWRLEVAEACAQPVVRGQILLAMRSGKLMSVDPQSGKVGRVANLPQPITSPPLVAGERGTIYQAGDHSSLYVFDGESLQCQAVYSTGHRAGTVTVAPILIGRYLLVAERSGANYTMLQPILLDDRGLAVEMGGDANVLRLDGYVVDSLRLSETSAVLTTDLGATYIVAADSTDAEQQLRVIAATAPSGASASPSYSAIVDGQVLVAGRGLERFEFQSANGSLVSRWTFSEPSIHVAAPLQRGKAWFIQYKRPASQAVRVLAFTWSGAGPSELVSKWSVDLGAAPAGPALFDKAARGVIAVANDASGWKVDAAAMKAKSQDIAFAELPGRTVFEWSGRTDNGITVYAARDGRKSYLLYDPTNRGSKLQRNDLQISAKRLACPLAVVGDRMIACDDSGSVHLIEPKSGKPLAKPYRHNSQLDATVDWVQPTALPDGSIVVATREGLFGLLAVNDGRLESKLSQSHETSLQSGLVSLADHVFVIGRSGSVTSLLCLNGNDLAIIESTPLDGPCNAGPFVVGDSVVCVVDKQLFAFDTNGQRLWTSELPDTPLVGAPAIDRSGWICASQAGRLWRVDAETGATLPWKAGSQQATFDAGEPLGATPLVMGSRLILIGRDCTLFILSLE